MLQNHFYLIYFLFHKKNVPSTSNVPEDDPDTIITQFWDNDTVNLLQSARRKVEVSKEKVDIGSLNVLSAKYEVLCHF